MKKELMKKGICVSLVVAMGLSLCACGGTKNANDNSSTHFYSVEYPDDLPATMSGNMGSAGIFGDYLIYEVYDDDYSSGAIYMYNMVEKTEQKLWESDNEKLDNGITISNSGVSYFAMDSDNNVYMDLNRSNVTDESLNLDFSQATLDDVIETLAQSWGESEDEALNDWNEWLSDSYTGEDGVADYESFMYDYGMEWEYSESLLKLDKNGNVVYEKVINEDSVNSYCNGIGCDANGYVYVLDNTWSEDGTLDEYLAQIYDEDGNLLGKITFDGYVDTLIQLPNGNVACRDYSSDTYGYRELDGKTMTASDEIIDFDGSMGSTAVYDEDSMLIRNDGVLMLYNLTTKESEQLLSFMDYNISSSAVGSLGVLSDGRIAIYSSRYSSAQGRTVSSLALLTEVNEEDVPKKEKIKIACMWLDSDVEEMAIEFNKKHEDYQISITAYGSYEGETYEDNLNAFTTAVASDKSIDIVIFEDYTQVVNFASKGLMTDMYQFLDADDELARDDLMPNVLTACEIGGKLVCLPTMFTVRTVVGKTSDVGTTPGWTVEQMQALLDSKPAGTELFYGMTRDYALNICMNLGYKDYIDSATATCNFDSEEFIATLEFANMFPEEYEYQDDDDSSVLINQGKVLLSEFSLDDYAEIQMYETIFNDSLTYIGYPTSSGNGAMISLNNIYGVTENCKNKDVAWEFLRQFYLPNESQDQYSWGFSVRKDDFEKYCEEAQKPLDGGWSWIWGDFEIEVSPATDEQIAAIQDLVYNATAVSGAVSDDIMNIINEEAAYYFSGEQSAESVAQKIQSRMQIYLSETK